jgi:hypothetical protein
MAQHDRPLATLLGDIATQLQHIVRGEVLLAKAEVVHDVTALRTGAMLTAAAVGVVVVAGGCSVMSVVFLLATRISLWRAFLVVAVTLLAVSGALAVIGRNEMRRVRGVAGPAGVGRGGGGPPHDAIPSGDCAMADVMTVLEQDIRRERAGLARNLQELEDRARGVVDWRTHYHRHTGLILAATAAGAACAGLLVRGSGKSAAFHREENLVTPRASLWSQLDPHGHASNYARDLAGDVIRALIGVAGTAAVGMVSTWVPGFGDEYAARRNERR